MGCYCPRVAAYVLNRQHNNPHPKTAPYQEILNRYFPSQETPRCWRAYACPIDPRLGGGGWGVVSWTRKLQHGDSNTPRKTTNYITCGTSLTRGAPKKMVRSWYVLGWFLCQDKPYGTIILTTISFREYNNNYKLWSYLSFYIWTLAKLLYKHLSMF